MIGLVPAAGRATRLGGVLGPGGAAASKEGLPVPCPVTGEVIPLARHLLGAFSDAGVDRAVVVLRDGKEDLRRKLAADPAGLALEWVATAGTASVPATLDLARATIAEAAVLTGFPDMLFRPRDATRKLRERFDAGGVDVVLGVFPGERPDKADMVHLDDTGRIHRIEVKPGESTSRETWILAAWGPRFTEFLHAEVTSDPGDAELHVGVVLQRAVDAGLAVVGERFPEGRYADLGTPEELAAIQSSGLC